MRENTHLYEESGVTEEKNGMKKCDKFVRIRF